MFVAGLVTTFVGGTGTSAIDGAFSSAQVAFVANMVVDSVGTIYLAEYNVNRIVALTTSGVKSGHPVSVLLTTLRRNGCASNRR